MILTYSHCKIQLNTVEIWSKELIIHILLIFEGRCAIIFFVPIIKRPLSWDKQYYFEDRKVESKKVVPFIVFWSRSFCYSHGNHFRISSLILTSLLEYVQLLTTSWTALSPQSQLFHFHWGFFGFKHCIIHNSNTGKCTHPCCTSKRILP